MNEKQLLLKYFPDNSVNMVMDLIVTNNVHLKITKQRSTKLGDYRPPGKDDPNHRISINHNLNPYSFLLTFIHELAHLKVWLQYKNRVQPHGPEWKNCYKDMILPFLTDDVFPEELLKVLQSSKLNFKASTGSDINLMRALKKYDAGNEDLLHLEELCEGELFVANKGKVFQKGSKRRTRYLCVDQEQNRKYLFHPLTTVQRFET